MVLCINGSPFKELKRLNVLPIPVITPPAIAEYLPLGKFKGIPVVNKGAVIIKIANKLVITSIRGVKFTSALME